MKISRHFDSEEFFNEQDPGPFHVSSPSIDLLFALELIRKKIGDRPIIITSGIRSRIHNRNVGGVKHSKHLLGRAADFYVPSVPGEYSPRLDSKTLGPILARLLDEGVISYWYEIAAGFFHVNI